MKWIVPVALTLSAAILLGCGKSEQTSQPPSTSQPAATNQPGVVSAVVNVATNQDSAGAAIGQYGSTLATARRTTQIKTDLISVDRAIQAFQADRARNPESLDELIKEGFLHKLPELPVGKKYSYDPNTGTVKVVDGQ
jgi:hypothetical protein